MRSLRGQFVLAGPKMDDPNFKETVVVMVEHYPPGGIGGIGDDGTPSFVPGGEEDDEHSDPLGESPGEQGPGTATLTGQQAGALGLVVNRELPVGVSEAWAQVSDNECMVAGRLRRGGPCPGPLMVLHRVPDRAQFQVMDGVYFTTHEHDVRWLVEQHGDDVLVFTGYSGWGAGQIESEVEQGAWMAVPGSAGELFRPDVGGLWARLIGQADSTLGRVVKNRRIVPDDPSVN